MAGESSLPRKWQWLVARFAICGALLGCAPPEPLRLGFLGGISGRVADLGIAGRNGATLAVEMRNSSGGVNGRAVELIVEDDKQDPDLARKAVGRLLERKVEAIIGPMTSAMAVATVPLVNEAELVMLSPTVTTPTLTGIDDHFLRVIASTAEYARVSAAYHFDRLGLRRVAAAYDLNNRAYTEGWLADYRHAFESTGGTLGITVPFSSGKETSFADLAVYRLLLFHHRCLLNGLKHKRNRLRRSTNRYYPCQLISNLNYCRHFYHAILPHNNTLCFSNR